ncbi:MAG: substrate-binding and vWA domain-containing protein [Pseudonocardiaceae bacterium]
MREALTGTRGTFRTEHCELLRNPSTPDVVLDRVRHAVTTATDVLLLYVVAHLGINNRTSTPMLATAGVRPDDFLPDGLPLDALLHAVDESTALVRIVLLDCVARPHESPIARDWRDRYLTEASRRPGTCLVISETRAGDLPSELTQQPTVFARELSDLLTGTAERSASAVTVQQVAERLESRLREHRPPSSVRWQINEHVAERVLSRAHQQVPPADGVLTTVANGLSGVLTRRSRRAPRAARGPLLHRLSRFLSGTWWGRATIAAAIVLLAVAAVVVPSITGSTACKPPRQLRVLASPESYPAIQDAADHYSRNRLDDDGCRTVHLTVYQATTDAVLRAFGLADHWAQSGDTIGTDSPCAANSPGAADPATPGDSGQAGRPAPGRDVGPQPDVWFPDSILDVQRAKACLPPGSSAVSFADPVSVARSPLVLGVPEARPGFPSAGQLLPWENLLDYVNTAKLDLVRPNPTTSTAGLLHSVGIYETVTGSPKGQLPPDADLGAVRDIENSLFGEDMSVVDTEDLLCDLNPDQPVPAVLVSERALLSYNLGELPGCPVPPGQGRGLFAYYPADLLILDYPVVRLTWKSQTGDADQRRAAAQGFQDWLLSNAGQQLLTRHGLRPAREDVPQDPAELLAKPQGGAWRDVPIDTNGRPSEYQVQLAIDYYVKARTPGRVVFLLDVSSSMAAQGNVNTAKRLIGGTIDLMGPGDDAALITVPKSTDDSGPNPRDPQYAGPDNLRSQLVDAALVRNDAALYDAIKVARRAMDRDSATVKRALVVITDGEDIADDGGAISRSRVDQVFGSVSTPTVIPIHVLALSPGVCDPQNFARLLAEESGGQCVTTIDNATATKLGASVFAGSNNG